MVQFQSLEGYQLSSKIISTLSNINDLGKLPRDKKVTIHSPFLISLTCLNQHTKYKVIRIFHHRIIKCRKTSFSWDLVIIIFYNFLFLPFIYIIKGCVFVCLSVCKCVCVSLCDVCLLYLRECV